MAKETTTDRWKRCVKEAKLLIISRDAARIRICELTLEACGEIHWGGGGHWSGFANQLTVTKFAQDINIHPKTLLEWIAIKRYVHDHLSKKYRKDAKWSVMAKVRRAMAVRRDEIPTEASVTRVYEEFLDAQNQPTYNVLRYLGHLKYSIDNLDQAKMTEEDIYDIRDMCKSILKKIKDLSVGIVN